MKERTIKGWTGRRGWAALAAAAGVAALACAMLLPDKRADVPGWTPVNAQVAATLQELGAAAPLPSGSAAADAKSAPAPVALPGDGAPAAAASPMAGATAAGSGPGGAGPGQGGTSAASPAVGFAGALAAGSAGAPAAGAAAADIPPTNPGPPASANANGLLNLNAATAEQLDALPGIGPAKARAIVEYRDAKGPFRSVDDLRQVKGIGPKLMEGLRDLVTVG
ncbi:ComEA family DNA-binding protein [Cohnella nanjingensis]|uniref:ComEA family DNA-binding protein n=1 Tax=Cohnella nanjingensis TaxID=1387779 RepID=A0A7X0RUH5_9BACL|nr:ComEA family DNA-binding protein [Cohnella nanjingensis]MBB6673947.1 ComEA family DNA-binding protein [Cohnella nanjingensis]